MINLVHNCWFTQWFCEVWRYWITFHVDRAHMHLLVHADLTNSMLDFFVARRLATHIHFFCNIDIQNSQMCKDIHFPYILKCPLFLVSIPQILGVYLTILLTIESTKFEANMFGLAFLLIQVQRTWWNIGAKNPQIQKLMKFWSRKEAIIIEQINS